MNLAITRLSDIINIVRQKPKYYPSTVLKKTQRTKIAPMHLKYCFGTAENDVPEKNLPT